MATSSTNTLQSDGASSSLKSNTRGPTRGESTKKVGEKIGGGRLHVEFSKECRQVIGPNFEKFNNECGIICRTACPFNYTDWRKVPATVKASLRERILINFDVDLSSKTVIDVIDFQMGRSFKNYRAKLQEHFLECNGEEDVERAKGLKPTDSNISDEAWHTLCDYWSSEKFQVMSKKNSENRGKRKYVSLNGTMSTPNHHLRNRGRSDGPIGEIDTFRTMHYSEIKGWVNDYARTSYKNMVQIKRQTASAKNPPSDLDIMQLVLGKRSAYIRGWSRVPSTRSDSDSRDSTGSSRRLSYTEMSARLVSTEAELASTKSELAQIKDGMAELRQMLKSIASAQSLLNFSSESLNVQEHGSETRDLGTL